MKCLEYVGHIPLEAFNDWVRVFKVHKRSFPNEKYKYMDLDAAHFYTCLEMCHDYSMPIERDLTIRQLMNNSRVMSEMETEIEKELADRFSWKSFPSIEVDFRALQDRIRA